jgi:hypothetical protein
MIEAALAVWAAQASPRDIADRIADLERTLARLAGAEEDIPQFWRDEAAQAVNRSRRFEAAAQ